MTETDALLILNAIPGLGNIRNGQLIDYFGSALSVLKAKRKEFAAVRYLPHKVVDHILSFSHDEFLQKEKFFIKENNITIITYNDTIYPSYLKSIPDAPIILYVKGRIQPDNALAIAIVGSRRASVYGITTAEKFAGQLAELGITVVSGMARGIDTSAHRGALKAHGKTIAVVGCGLTQVYPPENKKIFDEIAQNGVVISEFPMQAPAVAGHFPRRNRIISGLSLGVIVVEAHLRSGALITADCALEQGREVFAVPGGVDNPNSKGVHKLIQQGAKLVSCVDDVIEELKTSIAEFLKNRNAEPVSAFKRKRISGDFTTLTSEEDQILRHLSDRPLHIDQLASEAQRTVSTALAVLLQLEIKSRVRQLPGKVFVRT